MQYSSSPVVQILPFHGQQKIAAKRDLLMQNEQPIKNSIEKSARKTRSPSVQANRSRILDINSHKSHSDHPTRKNFSPIQFRFDSKIQQATVKTYERQTSTTTREAAIHCLQEAAFFTRKSWIKQVEISKEMIKQRALRLIRQTDDEKLSSVLTPIRVISTVSSSRTTRVPTGKTYEKLTFR